MPFRDHGKVLPGEGADAPRRVQGIVIAGELSELEAMAHHAPTRLMMSFNEFNNLCIGVASAVLPGARATVCWSGSTFIFAIEGAAAKAVAVGRRLLEERREFARVHGVAKVLDLGCAAGEILVARGGADGARAPQVFGPPVRRARELHAMAEELAAQHGRRDLLICEAKIVEAADVEHPQGEGIACVG